MAGKSSEAVGCCEWQACDVEVTNEEMWPLMEWLAMSTSKMSDAAQRDLAIRKR
jgi:hypothetical protein